MTKLVVNKRDKQYVMKNYLDGMNFEELSHFKKEALKLYPESSE